MEDVKESIGNILATARSAAILCSWGRDSSLLLHYARQVKPDIVIYYFGDNLPSLAAELVMREDVTVCSFAPRRSYVSRETLIDEYSFNGVSVPMLSAVTTGGKCGHGHLKSTASDVYFPHDVILWGYRQTDSHPLLPGLKFDREIQLGHTKFVAPLYDLTTDQVLNTLDALNLDYVDDFPVEICDNCMNALAFNASTLAGFQERQINH